MASERSLVYDPKAELYDSTQLQQRDLQNLIGDIGFTFEDFAKHPEAVLLLLQQHNVALNELRGYKLELGALRNERDQLRIEKAKMEERSDVSIMEIPVSFLGGYAMNMLYGNLSDPLGWLLLLITLILLAFLRKPQISRFVSWLREEANDAPKN